MLEDLDAQIHQCMLKDRFRFRRRLRELSSKSKNGNQSEKQTELETLVAKSVEMRARRSKNLPAIETKPDLPITAHAQEIIDAIRERQVIVVAGETGSGKSTQLPQLCLQAGYGISGMIGHTQPRRIAARSVAARIAEEMKTTLGHEVGFKIRFTDKSDDRTYIKLMTDGILLAETQNDRFLEQYEVIIVDEAHERSLNIDFLIGYLHRLLYKRRDLRIIITSATLDPERFAKHFADDNGPAPIVEVSGRTFPVDVLYRPAENEEQSVNDQIVDAVRELSRIDRGDILIFLPTERDIRDASKRLRAELNSNSHATQVLPLYARLSAAEQNRIFQTGKQQRIVLATNVAESSLTVPGIRYVIDTGTARISRYSPRLKVQRLPIESVSQASANQRKGRCGRVADGVCIRLYDEDDFESRDEFTTPEIRRTNLASVILQSKSLQMGKVEDIPFLDPPRSEAIRDGYKTLFEIGAVDNDHDLTKVGHKLAQMPVDPRIGRIILAGHAEGCLDDILIIASGLEVQDPRDRPYDKQQAADEKHQQFQNEESDFLSYVNLWNFFHRLKGSLSRSQLQKACRQNFISLNRMREWQEIHRQLLELTRRNRFRNSERSGDSAAIHRALLTGLLSGVAHRTGDFEYTGAGGVKFNLWPGSALFHKKPLWIIAAEIVETSKRFGRTVAGINPSWIEPLADHLVKKSYSDPHWHIKSETVMAFEKVSLFGLPVVAKRRARYGKHDPSTSRQIFIQHALVEQKLRSEFPFVTHNRTILEELESLTAKTRRRDTMVDEYSLYSVYDVRIPDNVFDADSLRRWIGSKRKERNEALSFSIEDFVEDDSATTQLDAFPDQISIGSIQAPAEYQFQPGEDLDGVTVTIPLEALNQLGNADTGWVVPGLLEEKVIGLIRSLPKSIRRNLVPAPDTAKKVVSQMTYGQGEFLGTVAKLLSAVAEEPISVASFRLEKLAPHLNLNIRVVDSKGKVKATGRDAHEIRDRLGSNADTAATPAIEHKEWNRDGITEWDFGNLPDEIVLDRGGIAVPMYPAIVDATDSVQLRLLDSRDSAKYASQYGIMRLVALSTKKSLLAQVRWLPNLDQMKIYASPLMKAGTLEQQSKDLIALVAVRNQKKTPTSKGQFDALLTEATEQIAAASQDVARVLPRIFDRYHGARLAMDRLKAVKFSFAINDIKGQLSELLGEDFLVKTPFNWLQQFPRYLEAIEARLDKVTSGALNRDQAATHEIFGMWQMYQQQRDRNQTRGIHDPALEEYRWMLEEYRVSQFAQTLGTIMKVSSQRLEKQWAKIRN